MLHGYTPPARFLPYLSWTEIDALPDRENTVIVLPAGAIEQHGPHLPCAVDSIVAAGVVGHAMAKLPHDVPAYALPPITYGKSDEHLHFPGTVTLTGELLLHTAIEIGESVYRAGFRKLVIVNAHGGQPQPLEMAARELRLRHGDYVIIVRSAWSVAHDGSFFSDDERKLAMHAGHGETAILMELAPDTVHMERAVANVPPPFPCPTLSNTRPAAAWCARDFGASGVIGDPRGATLEQGKQLLDQLSTQWATAIGEVHRMQWPAREATTWGRGQFTGHIESRRTSSRVVANLLGATSLALLAGLLGLSPQAHAGTPFTMVTNWYAQAEHGGFYEAQAEGLYAKAGLDVTLRMGGPQVNSTQLLAAGQAQCVITDDIGTMNARAHGIPMQLVATSFQHDPTVLIAHDDVPDIKALRTRTILASSAAYASWWPWAKVTLGFKDDQVRPYTFNIQPFMASANVAQQGYLTSEPYSLTKAGAKFKVFALGDAGYPPYGNAIGCRTDVITQHPDQVAAFLKASAQGWKDYLANPVAGNAAIRKDNPDMTQDQLDYAVKALKTSGLVEGGDAKTRGIGVITAERLKASWTMAVNGGLVDPKQVPLDQVYTTRFVDRDPVLP